MEKARRGARPNPFIDPAGYKRAIARSEQAFTAELKRQGKPTPLSASAPEHSVVQNLR
jgi:hypothetical protein